MIHLSRYTLGAAQPPVGNESGVAPAVSALDYGLLFTQMALSGERWPSRTWEAAVRTL